MEGQAALTKAPAPQAREDFAHVTPEMARRVLNAALECFARRGYHATATREIAQACQLSPGGVYVHFASKEDILYEIVLTGQKTSLTVAQEAAARHPDDAHVARVKEIIRRLVTWHVDHLELARVAAYEQGSLPPERRAELRPYRREFFKTVERELIAGQATGEVRVDNPAHVTRAMLSLCTDIARWYRPGRGLGADELADAYGEMAVRLAGAS